MCVCSFSPSFSIEEKLVLLGQHFLFCPFSHALLHSWVLLTNPANQWEKTRETGDLQQKGLNRKTTRKQTINKREREQQVVGKWD